MYSFEKDAKRLRLFYAPENDMDWVSKKFSSGEKIHLKRTFHLGKKDLVDSDEEGYWFEIGVISGEYYKIKRNVLSLKHDLFMHKDVPFDIKHFVAKTNVSIFRSISEIVRGPMYIGGDADPHLPFSEFQGLLRRFPTTYETEKYVQAKISSVLRNYFDGAVDAEAKYHKYVNSKTVGSRRNFLDAFRAGEKYKYETILGRLRRMLRDEKSYSEKQWQNEILQMILLIYPKYIAVFENVKIRDTYARKDKFLDFMLVDSNGNIDIVEIKQPFDNCVITKSQYRDNYIPLRELSGTVMQIEKYIFHLNKWGKAGEDVLTDRYEKILPPGFKIKITNPVGIIIMGRENSLKGDQRKDFEIVKRKYKNVVDVITYDDLVKRLETMVAQLSVKGR